MSNKIKTTVLIVEDDVESNANLAFFLQQSFGRVISAYNGKEGWIKYNEEIPDLIITDVEMPVMDGLTLIQKIRRHDNFTPIIVLSAYSDQHYLLKAIPLQLSDYLIKPITYSKLNDVLSRYLHSRYVKTGRVFFDDGDGVYDYDTKSAFLEGRNIKLTNKEIVFLELLVENRYRLISYDVMDEIGINTRNALKCIVRDLRKKLYTINIETVSKWGYKLR